jgi:hypothetical protein
VTDGQMTWYDDMIAMIGVGKAWHCLELGVGGGLTSAGRGGQQKSLQYALISAKLTSCTC